MHNETSKTQRTVLAVLAVVVGLYLMLLAPTQSMQTLKTSLDQALVRLVPFDDDFFPAIPILTATYSVWIVLFVLAGATLVMLTKKLYDGEKWARATALGLLALPSVGGMAMIIPWFVLVLAEYPQKGVPPATLSGMPTVAPVLFVGLIAYLIVLLADQDSMVAKLQKLVPYVFIGIVAGMVFMNGQHGARYFIHIPGNFIRGADGLIHMNPDAPTILSPLAHAITNLDHLDWRTFEYLTDEAVYSPQTLALLLGGYLLYVSSALLVLSIPFMAMKNKFGWYLATSTALATAVVSFQGFVVRSSTEWLQGGALSLVLLIILLIPVFKKHLIEE